MKLRDFTIRLLSVLMLIYLAAWYILQNNFFEKLSSKIPTTLAKKGNSFACDQIARKWNPLQISAQLNNCKIKEGDVVVTLKKPVSLGYAILAQKFFAISNGDRLIATLNNPNSYMYSSDIALTVNYKEPLKFIASLWQSKELPSLIASLGTVNYEEKNGKITDNNSNKTIIDNINTNSKIAVSGFDKEYTSLEDIKNYPPKNYEIEYKSSLGNLNSQDYAKFLSNIALTGSELFLYKFGYAKTTNTNMNFIRKDNK